METAFAAPARARADTPLPITADEFRSYTSRLSTERSLGLTPCRSAAVGPFRRLYTPTDDSTEQYALASIDGLGFGWHPDRCAEVVLVYCVWSDDRHKGQEVWQPLENVPFQSVMEYMRRCAEAGRLIYQWVSRDKHRPYYVGDPEPLRDDTTVFSNPDEPGHVSAPENPCVPEKQATAIEVDVFMNSQAKAKRAGIELPGIDLERVRTEPSPSLSRTGLTSQPVINVFNIQEVAIGATKIVSMGDVVDRSTRAGDVRFTQGDHGVITLQAGNRMYDPRLAPQEDD